MTVTIIETTSAIHVIIPSSDVEGDAEARFELASVVKTEKVKTLKTLQLPLDETLHLTYATSNQKH